MIYNSVIYQCGGGTEYHITKSADIQNNYPDEATAGTLLYDNTGSAIGKSITIKTASGITIPYRNTVQGNIMFVMPAEDIEITYKAPTPEIEI